MLSAGPGPRYLNYKFPRSNLSTEDDYVRKGVAYAFLTASEPKQWQYSEKAIDKEGSMLWNTWNEFYKNKKDSAYLFYNDQPPTEYTGTDDGHMKGFLAFKEDKGIWVIHSIPKFGEPSHFHYPKTGKTYGQTVFCVTYNTPKLNKIATYLLYADPNIYYYDAPEHILSLLNKKSKTLFSEEPEYAKNDQDAKQLRLKSAGGQSFRAFAKSKQLEQDIFEDIIAPALETSLFVQSWQRGKGNLKSRRKSNAARGENSFDVTDTDKINITMEANDGLKSVFWDAHNDHSKWAVSVGKKWICISDMNHMESQKRRGGGAVCFSSKNVHEAYNNTIAKLSYR